MPPARRQKSKDSKAQEERIQSAITDLQDGKLSSARQAALKYDVPSTTLLNRMKGVKSRSQTWANCHRLSLEDEESLSRWIISVTEQHETAPSRSQIEEKANAILASRSTTPNVTVGEKWVYNYLQRHEELRPIYPRRIYSRRIYTAVVGSASAETGSPSINPNRETGQPANQRITLPPPISARLIWMLKHLTASIDWKSCFLRLKN
ncbi:hypothetical protein ANOM_005906 [Aspergillus nomiae NRRL 13137]|uniref:HTH CENPB-type domain-containing protein n=1 Tax=Aspergillus nomiae NRRL (strain ATCC 15546 / NRRL 13137 / CBS 260.88 / M93) TaxID=1509407 RepID=A0A0L1J6K6_ASPN3|nr:uncharacterized protein ANOM_005906 [Aspergillus nomiae NRRL 13137]KNG87382.1 hypothetical protein ANOM_005906 [Aspergillus nomiae NRRL 13137]